MFSTKIQDLRQNDTSRLHPSTVDNDTGVVTCCGVSLGTSWNGSSFGTWDNNGTSHGTWSATTVGYAESTEMFTINDNATISVNDSQSPWVSNPQFSTWEIIVLSTLAGLTSLLTVGGNLTVLLSFLIERTIRQPTNYFIASLACSDLLIGLISMPLYTVYLLTGANWPLGEVVCDLWLSVDYTACLCSIYTVFCITIDRFCSVSIPTKYRNWRSASKVRLLVASTWILPTIVFFTTIFGWQFFVGERTVPEGKCYVQYMENAVFNCALQVGYFWTTLVVMCVLYAGIYRVALTLQRKSQAKLTKMASALTVDVTRAENHRRATAADEQERTRDTKEPPGSSSPWKFSADGLPVGRGTISRKSLPVVSVSVIPATVNGDQYSSSPVFLSDTEPSSPLSVQTLGDRRNTAPYVISSHEPPGGGGGCGVIRTADADVGCNKLLRPPPREMSKRGLQRYYQSLELDVNVGEGYNRRGSSGDTLPSRSTERDQPRCGRCVDDGKECAIVCPEGGVVAGNRLNGHSELRLESVEGSSTNRDDVQVEKLSLTNNATVGHDAARCQHHPTTPESETSAPLQTSPVWKRRNGTFEDFHCCSLDREVSQMVCDVDTDGVVTRSRSVCTHSTTVDSFNDTVTAGQTRSNCAQPIPDLCYHRQCYSIDYSTSDTLDESATPLDESSRWQLTEDSQVPPFSYQDGDATSASRDGRHGGSRPSASQLQGRTKSSKRSTKSSQPGSARPSLPGRGRKTVNRAKKALRTITIILGAFVVCWTPWHILSLIVGFCPDYGAALQTLYDVSYWLCYLNSPINPFCYAFANHQLKKTFIRILRLDWHRT